MTFGGVMSVYGDMLGCHVCILYHIGVSCLYIVTFGGVMSVYCVTLGYHVCIW